MNETVWILKVQKEVRQRLGDSYDVDLGNLRREDGTFMQGLILRKKGAPVSLTVEVPAWAIGSEETAGQAADLILELFNKERSMNRGTWNPKDFSTVKHRIARRIIPTKENKKLLEEAPHIDFLDWSIVGYLYLTDEEGNAWTGLLRWEHLRFWDITEQQMWELARSNTPALLPARIRQISEREERLPLYLLSSEQGIYGASCLLYDHLLRQFCEEKGYDSILILPISVHEVFLFPEEKVFYAEYLKEAAVKGIYRESQREERLTDSVYRYECENGRLTICR